MRCVVASIFSLAACDVFFPLKDPSDATLELHPCSGVALVHDEDGDELDDSCDRCPTVGDKLDRDRDGDGVGDACDPSPDDMCEERVLFDGFATGAPSPAIKTNAWSFDQDDLVQGDLSAKREIFHYPMPTNGMRPFRDTIVRAAIFVPDDGIDVTQMFPFVEIGSGVLIVNSTDRDAGYSCRLLVEAPANPQVLDVELGNLAAGGAIVSTSFNNDGTNNAGEVVFELHNAPTGELACSITGQGAGAVSANGPSNMSIGEVMIFVDNVSIRVHWIEVIEHTCPR